MCSSYHKGWLIKYLFFLQCNQARLTQLYIKNTILKKTTPNQTLVFRPQVPLFPRTVQNVYLFFSRFPIQIIIWVCSLLGSFVLAVKVVGNMLVLFRQTTTVIYKLISQRKTSQINEKQFDLIFHMYITVRYISHKYCFMF